MSDPVDVTLYDTEVVTRDEVGRFDWLTECNVSSQKQGHRGGNSIEVNFMTQINGKFT